MYSYILYDAELDIFKDVNLELVPNRVLVFFKDNTIFNILKVYDYPALQLADNIQKNINIRFMNALLQGDS